MTILYVSDSTTVSGAEIVFLGYVEALRGRGHRPYGFISRRNPRLADALRERGVPFVATDAYTPRVIRTTANPAALASFARSFIQVAREMSALVREVGVEFIHSISYPASLYAALAASRCGVPQIWHEHNIKHLHPVNKVIYRWVAGTCRWVVGPSDAVTNNLARAGIAPGTLRTIYNGIDLTRFSVCSPAGVDAVRSDLRLAPGDHSIGLFGQMLPYKGHGTLIDAAPAILREHPRSRFYFVGALENPPYERELRARITAAGLSDRFAFTGWRPDVQGVVRAMDVVVVATVTPEPAALMLMEAMAVGRPVVATRTGGTSEIVIDEETGLLFGPGSADELAERVNRILGNPEMARSFGLAGRRRVETRFAREQHFSEMFALYEAP